MQATAKLPFEVTGRVIGEGAAAAESQAVFTRWLEGLKKEARNNLESGESIRIAWTNRYKIPRYPRYDQYTPEEVLVELWEQYYFEHPDSVEMHGIIKRRNAQTGYSYYRTGDPLLDQFEEAFGRGECPDMSVLNNGGGGVDIFREPVFVHTERGPGFKPGQPVAPQQGLEGVQETKDGAKLTAGGAKVHHTDFSSDDWLKAKLDDDVALRALADKLGGSGG